MKVTEVVLKNNNLHYSNGNSNIGSIISKMRLFEVMIENS